ncbi:Hypothetical predicted protein [Podarcis lilfordi]|uniref:Uncharacterized protein n=1 Tax=Podarcis lilfordi TaxID=74358 RepID=A0AA35NS75_9SAUR|nr:Hypothetical predicted protein [Podarcis lilfordi]
MAGRSGEVFTLVHHLEIKADCSRVKHCSQLKSSAEQKKDDVETRSDEASWKQSGQDGISVIIGVMCWHN